MSDATRIGVANSTASQLSSTLRESGTHDPASCGAHVRWCVGGPVASDGRCAALALECAVELWATQRALLGPLHPDGAETLRHVGALLQHLLASAPQLLFERFPDWGTAAAAAHAERRAMQLHAGIARLYDNGRVAREAQ